MEVCVFFRVGLYVIYGVVISLEMVFLSIVVRCKREKFFWGKECGLDILEVGWIIIKLFNLGLFF